MGVLRFEFRSYVHVHCKTQLSSIENLYNTSHHLKHDLISRKSCRCTTDADLQFGLAATESYRSSRPPKVLTKDLFLRPSRHNLRLGRDKAILTRYDYFSRQFVQKSATDFSRTFISKTTHNHPRLSHGCDIRSYNVDRLQPVESCSS